MRLNGRQGDDGTSRSRSDLQPTGTASSSRLTSAHATQFDSVLQSYPRAQGSRSSRGPLPSSSGPNVPIAQSTANRLVSSSSDEPSPRVGLFPGDPSSDRHQTFDRWLAQAGGSSGDIPTQSGARPSASAVGEAYLSIEIQRLRLSVEALEKVTENLPLKTHLTILSNVLFCYICVLYQF